jgi:hypothetical protein
VIKSLTYHLTFKDVRNAVITYIEKSTGGNLPKDPITSFTNFAPNGTETDLCVTVAFDEREKP